MPVDGEVADTARSQSRRQSDSARRYLDFEATTPALRSTVEFAARSVGFAIAQLNVLDEDTQYTLVNVGGPPVSTVDRADTLCDDVVRTGDPAVVALGRVHATTRQRAILDDNGIASYASVPLRGREGLVIGTLCLLDRTPRSLSGEQMQELEQFASVLEEQLDLHRRVGSGVIRLGSDNDIADSIADGHIVPWFQSIVDLRTEEIVGFEALARWHHPTRGMVVPADFVPFAEASELIIDVDLSVLTQAAAEMKKWHVHRPDLRLTVNISGRHLAHPDGVSHLERAIASSGVSPSSISLELTETTAVTPGPLLRRHIDDVHRLGFRVLLDDFGSGWSSLERLVTLQPDGIKIDGHLTRFVDTVAGRAMIRSLAGVAKDLDLTMIVEGIESREQADAALELGCTLAQGYLWSRPQSAQSVLRTIADSVGSG
ncbi:diguanylate phosphodiesterase [Rhodococcus sp. 14-2483-1-1]|uniref:sensor domain-containing phosphodiesterase n=1 Tax=Rhodococcus sp. 14-2483-1-1 TaxID=2023148 RepID=UPI0005619ECE|nr:EAL domain-containing protein [Rhodococcus sp. 14-2483-1-1]OZC47352.1 diguanylate phosphodiesterase [Rhodococcus sp. WWJCD1]OZE79710.1 diguanylate phosphodiesterase [Rhodococcus sp. 15-649-2-2]QII02445.1 EAL domain-containing protein [Rhodococcus fascians A21d2]QII05161.1 EAL domain-containing protein [Rhodococcus fascians A25f]OZF34395.1 diguanylate phosphodiesterase [Rhodococcus sp. 14-2483-1-1]